MFRLSFQIKVSVQYQLIQLRWCICTQSTYPLTVGTSLAAMFLRANGTTLFKVREETVKLLGKGDLYFFSPEHPPLTEEAQRVLDCVVDKKLKSGIISRLSLSH